MFGVKAGMSVAVTPLKPKTVSFQLPGGGQRRASTAPANVQRRAPPMVPPPAAERVPFHTTAPPVPVAALMSPPRANLRSQPDLIADIYHQQQQQQQQQQPKTQQHPCKIEGLVLRGKPLLESPSGGKISPAVATRDISLDVSLGSHRVKHEQRVLSGQAKVSKGKLIKGHRTGPTSRLHVGPGASGRFTGYTTKMVQQIQEQTNVSSLNFVRWIKCDVTKLREHLLKIEDEIKLANKAKAVLDGHVLDMRKSLSVNQQSITAQQKKTHKEDAISKRLRVETHVLSKWKRRLEQHLMQMKSHLWNLDSMRKTIKSKLSILSRTLEMDAQQMKIYEGPVVTRPESVSKKRHYSNACPVPENTTGDEAVAQLCCKVAEVIGASRNLRSEMKSLVQSAYSNKAEAHEKITSAVAKSVEGMRAHQSGLVLQKGKVRSQQNLLSHHQHMEELSIGLALGAHSESYKSVSEKVDRPLSRIRPESAAVESKSYKHLASNITRQLSASAGRASHLATSGCTLGRDIHNAGQDTTIDSHMLRNRRAFMDSRK